MGYYESINMVMRMLLEETRERYAKKWNVPQDELQEPLLARLMVKNSDFSAATFLDEAMELFLMVTKVSQMDDLKTIQPYITKNLYDSIEKRLQEYQRENEKEVWEHIQISDAVITDYQEKQHSDYLEVTLQILMVHYIVKCDTGKLRWKHSKKRNWYQYQMKFVHKEGEVHYREQRIECPHCGAQVKVKNQAKCPYCKSVVTASATRSRREKHRWKWLLNDISCRRCVRDNTL